MHIYDPERFAFAPSPRAAPGHAAVSDYRLLQTRIGTTRAVIITPRNYGIDNRATIDVIAHLGEDATGVAVLRPEIKDAELNTLREQACEQSASVSGIPRQRW